jgi:hypothetical protein
VARLSLFGSFTPAKGQYCAALRAVTVPVVGSGFSCNPNFSTSQLGVVTRWTPVKNLTFSAEVQWFHLDQKFTGAVGVAVAAPKPAAVYKFADQDVISFDVRAQRNF